jgi:1-acyl-sn-glycerol-3-phosphate acyltransferase
MGAFLSAAERSMPIVPIAIRGTRFILRSDSWYPRRGAIRITIGKPITPHEASAGSGASRWAVALELRDSTRAFILHHCGEPDLSHEQWPNLSKASEV